MALNCKPGDLAIVVQSMAGNQGKVCTCLKLYPAGHDSIHEKFGPVWEVDVEMNGIWDDDGVFFIGSKTMPDMNLRPLRDNPGQDETLQWLDVPHKEAA